jgi:hypothetical protein
VLNLLTSEELRRALLVVELIDSKGYRPEHITLEKELHVGSSKPRLDLLLSNPDGTPFLCAEVKATLSGQDVSSVLKTQLFPYMDLSHAPYGALVSSRTGTDGVVTLDTHLLDRSLTGVPLRNTGLGSGSARLGPARYSIATPLVRLSRVTCLRSYSC